MNGTGGKSIFGAKFEDENFDLAHGGPGAFPFSDSSNRVTPHHFGSDFRPSVLFFSRRDSQYGQRYATTTLSSTPSIVNLSSI